MGFAGMFVYKFCKKEREDEGGDIDYSVAVTNSLFREERLVGHCLQSYPKYF